MMPSLSSSRDILRRMKMSRDVSATSLADLQSQYVATVELIEALGEQVDRFNGQEWAWIVERWIPARRLEIQAARSEVPPDDAIRQAMIQGQLNENSRLTEIFNDAKAYLANMKQRRDAISKRIEHMKKSSTGAG